MKAAIYLRVSTAKQAEKWSLPAQEHALIEHCQRQEWDHKIFSDAGISGETIAERPGIQQLLKEVAQGGYGVVLAVELERFSRSKDLFDWLVIKKTFRDAGVKFGTPTQLYDPADAEDDFVSDLLGTLSKREKAKTLARTMRGTLEAVRQGKYFTGNAPFGYRAEEGTLYVVEAEAALVRRIFEMACRGGTIRSIARRLTVEGIPTPMTTRGDVRAGKEWRVGTVSHILHNRFYTGVASWNKRRNVKVDGCRRTEDRPESEHIAVKVPAIIDAGLFATVQKQLEDSAKFSPRHQNREYLLKGLLYCSCGRRMYGFPSNGIRYYKCAGKVAHECTRPMQRADSLEMAACREVVEVLLHPDAILALASKQREGFGKRDESLVRLDAVNGQVARIPQSRSRLIDSYTEGTIDKAEFKAKMAALQERKRRLEDERASLQTLLGQVHADELTALRMAEILAQREVIGRTLAALAGLEGTLPRREKGRSLPGPLPVDILRAVLRRVTVGADGALTFEAVVPLKAREKSASAARSR